MRIVVVGATGNIGTALLRAVAQRSSVTQVDAVSRRGPGRLDTPGVVIRHHQLDLATPPGSADHHALAQLAAGADAVVHLAWAHERSGERTTAANVALTTAVLRAAARSRQVVLASCASVYSPSYEREPRTEDWPTEGVEGSHSSSDKVGMERLADRFSHRHPGVVVTRIRAALTLQESAGAELARRAGLIATIPGLSRAVPMLLWPQGLRVQVAHADDVAAAILASIERRAPGAYNIASPDVLDGEAVAAAVGAGRLVELPRTLAAGGHRAAWWTRVLSVAPDWLLTLEAAPVLDTSRARDLLGVVPVWSGADTLAAAARGLTHRREGWTPALSRGREPKQNIG